MSHVVQQKSKIKSITALRDACQRLGLEIEERSSFVFEQGNRSTGAKYVLRAKQGTKLSTGSYAPQEIGLLPQQDGTYALAMGSYANGICDLVGSPTHEGGERVLAPTLLQHYNMSVVKETADQQGLNTEFFQGQNGTWRARVTGQQLAALAVS